jgi:hypothetical protein
VKKASSKEYPPHRKNDATFSSDRSRSKPLVVLRSDPLWDPIAAEAMNTPQR